MLVPVAKIALNVGAVKDIDPTSVGMASKLFAGQWIRRFRTKTRKFVELGCSKFEQEKPKLYGKNLWISVLRFNSPDCSMKLK